MATTPSKASSNKSVTDISVSSSPSTPVRGRADSGSQQTSPRGTPGTPSAEFVEAASQLKQRVSSLLGQNKELEQRHAKAKNH